MEKTVLVIGYDPAVEAEIKEYIEDKSSGISFAHSNEEAIRILDEHPVTSIILNLRMLNDAVILSYVNQYYPGIHVVVSATEEFDEVITIFAKARFARIQSPMRLEQLKTMLGPVGTLEDTDDSRQPAVDSSQ
jgi:DNA-binding NtrC family response regulator